MEKLVLTSREASKLVGIPVPALRELLTRGKADIGVIYPPKRKGGNKTYRFYKNKLLKEVGALKEVLERGEDEE